MFRKGSQPNSVLRIGGKGLPFFGDTKRGDIFVRIHITIPENIDEKERFLYKQLRDMEKDKK